MKCCLGLYSTWKEQSMSTSNGNSIGDHQIDLYKARFLEFGDNPKSTFQNDTSTMTIRYDLLVRDVLRFLPVNFSILDVGCGLGDLHKFLLEIGLQHHYTGVEIVEEMVELAMVKYPEANFYVGNFLGMNLPKEYDFVVASGTYNMKGHHSDDEWYTYVEACISRMYELAKIAISFNALSPYSDYRDNSLFYFDEDSALALIRSKSRFINLSYLSPLFEFTVSALKPASMQGKYMVPELNKYF